MYVKFCRLSAEDKQDGVLFIDGDTESSRESKSCAVPGVKGNDSVRQWKGLSAVLAGICVLLLFVVLLVILKPQPLNCQGLHKSATSGYPRKPHPTPCNHTKGAMDGAVRLIPTRESQQQSIPTRESPQQSCLCRQCPVGWLEYGKSCFSLSTLRGSWDEGLKECMKKGGRLATVTTQQVQTFLNKKGTMKYWIGLRQTGNGTWAWVGNSPMKKSYWSDPRGKGDCVYVEGNSPTEENWKQSPCQVKTYYICELQLVKN